MCLPGPALDLATLGKTRGNPLPGTVLTQRPQVLVATGRLAMIRSSGIMSLGGLDARTLNPGNPAVVLSDQIGREHPLLSIWSMPAPSVPSIPSVPRAPP